MIDILTCDAETVWDTDYSLSKMTPLEYVMDDRFELISMSFKLNHERSYTVFGEDEIRRAFAQYSLDRMMALGHNMSGFDAYILAMRLRLKPRLWACTLAMAQPLFANTVGVSLKAVAKELGVGIKDNTILLQTKGKRLADFTDAEIEEMRRYNGDDSDLCRGIFDLLYPYYSPEEMWQIDALTRCRTEPKLFADRPLLAKALQEERERKARTFVALGARLDVAATTEEELIVAVKAELASQPKFAALLTELGVEVPMKASKTDPNKQIPALSKTDEAFLALQDHPNELVAQAAQARLEVKSTITESRIQAMDRAAELCGGFIPQPLKYCGAAVSGRDSGEEYNPQNYTRINPKKPRPSDALRGCLTAPDGFTIIVADQSGIELRTAHTLAQVEESMALYRANPLADLYRAYGATRYNCAPEEVNGERRQMCKVAQLQLQFGSGAFTFMQKARLEGLDMDLEAATDEVNAWRAKYHDIKNCWQRGEEALKRIVRGVEGYQVDPWGHLTTCSEGIRLPSGRIIRYPHLRFLDFDGALREFFAKKPPRNDEEVEQFIGWWYGLGRHKRRIYGAKVFHNGVQSLARDSVFDCSIDFYRATGYRFSLRVHDELLYVVPTAKAQHLLDKLQAIMRTPPRWWPELVVWSEGDLGQRYSELK